MWNQNFVFLVYCIKIDRANWCPVDVSLAVDKCYAVNLVAVHRMQMVFDTVANRSQRYSNFVLLDKQALADKLVAELVD